MRSSHDQQSEVSWASLWVLLSILRRHIRVTLAVAVVASVAAHLVGSTWFARTDVIYSAKAEISYRSGTGVIANLGVGPADLVARTVVYGKPAFTMGPSGDVTATFRERARSAVSIYGTAYLWTAGLMNLLLLFDVWDIGRGRKP